MEKCTAKKGGKVMKGIDNGRHGSSNTEICIRPNGVFTDQVIIPLDIF